jgi:hypothetical protein
MASEQTDTSMEMYLFVHKDHKVSLSREKLNHEKNFKLKISCQTPFKGLCTF